jgi:Icc-related predicted phosphoesterase
MRIRAWCISDTHCKHAFLTPPIDCNTIIIAGDFSNYKLKSKNFEECKDFYEWLYYLPFTNKIVVAGNHDTSLETAYGQELLRKYNFTYLQHESTEVEGVKIFGSPYTPTFGEGWSFNKSRAGIGEYWKDIPLETELLITHGPPKGMLDLSHNREHKLEYCGDSALLGAVKRLPRLKYHIFGHIHNTEDGDINQGTRTHGYLPTTFVNASCVTDGQFDKGPSSNGVIIEI